MATPSPPRSAKNSGDPDLVLDLRLFANIHNDPNLQGTKYEILQGADLERSIEYLCQLVDRLESGNLRLAGFATEEQQRYVQNLIPLRKQLLHTIKIVSKMKALYNTLSDLGKAKDKKAREADRLVEEAIHAFESEVIPSIIKTLTEEGSILIPGGWAGLHDKPGHAMLYELKMEGNKLILLVHNMGAGSQGHHISKRLADKTYYSSIKAYQLEISDLASLTAILPPLLKTLFKPRYEPVLSNKAYNSDMVYDAISRQAAVQKFKEIDPTPYCRQWTSGQESGTCGFRIFESFMMNFDFPQGLSYSDLQYEIFFNSIRDHFENNKNNLSNGIVQRQMNFALQNFSRVFQALIQKAPPLLNPSRVQSGVELIQEVSKALSAQSRSKSAARTLPQYSPDSLFKDQNLPETKALPEREAPLINRDTLSTLTGEFERTKFQTETATLVSGSSPEKPSISTPNFEAKNTIESLEQLQAFVLRSEKNSENGSYAQVAREIERLSFQRDHSYWATQPEEQLELWLDNFYKLQKLYQGSLIQYDAKPFAERQNIFMQLEIVAFDITSALFKENKALVSKIASLLHKDTYDLYTNNQKSPYFITLEANQRQAENQILVDLARVRKQSPAPDMSYINRHYLNVLLLHHDANEIEKILELCNKKIKEVADPHYSGLYHRLPAGELEKAPNDEKCLFFAMFFREVEPEQFEKELPLFHKKLSQVLKTAEMIHRTRRALSGQMDCSPHSGKLRPGIFICGYGGSDISITQTHTGEHQCTVNDPMYQRFLSGMKMGSETTQAPFHNPQIKRILESQPESSNKIQTESDEKVLGEKTNLIRRLKNIRLQPILQITQTIDFMKRSPSQLSDPDIQQFFLMNLFKGGLVENQCDHSPSSMVDLVNVIQQGLRNSLQKNEIKKEALFYLKLAVYLYALLWENPTLRDKPHVQTLLKELKGVQNNLSTAILLCETKIGLTEDLTKKQALEELLPPLHQLRLIASQDIVHEYYLSDEELFQKISSFIYIKINPKSSILDPFLEHMTENVTIEMQAQLHASLRKLSTENPSSFQHLFNRLLKNLDVSGLETKTEEGRHWDPNFTYPWISLVSDKDNRVLLSMNLTTGVVTKGTAELIPLPDFVSKNRVFQKFFEGSKMMVTASPDRNVFEFSHNKSNYRFFYQHNKTSINSFNFRPGLLQKEILISEKTEWCEYVDPSNLGEPGESEEESKEKSKYFQDLPLLLKDGQHELWMRLEKNSEGNQDTFILDASTKALLYQFDGKRIYELDTLGAKNGFYVLNSADRDRILKLVPSLERFEDPKFMIMTKREDPSEIRIQLPRYGISFIGKINVDGNVSEFIYGEDPRYKLKDKDDVEFIPNFKHHLRLTPIIPVEKKRLDKREQDKVLIPHKLFIAKKESEGEYHKLEFDTSYQVMKKLMSNKKEASVVDCEITSRWASSEKFSSFTVTSGQSLKPESDHSRLHLSFLYLAKRQPLLAFDELQEVLKSGALLNEADLMVLQNIISELPAKLKSSSDEEQWLEKDAEISTPEFTAVRALAFYIIMTKKKEGVKLGGERHSKNPTIHEKHYNYRHKEFTDFWQHRSLRRSILTHMEAYLKQRPHMPVELQLTETQELEMLRYLMFSTKVSPPNIVFRRRQLELNQLTRERDRLEALKKERAGKLSKILMMRLEHLNKRISGYPTVKIDMQKRYERAFVNVPLPEVVVPLPTIHERRVPAPTPIPSQNILGEEQDRFKKLRNAREGELRKSEGLPKKVQAFFKPKPALRKASLQFYEEDKREYEKGLENNLVLKAREEASYAYFEQQLATLEQRNHFKTIVEAAILKGNNELPVLKNELLTFANKEPSDPAKRGEWTLRKTAQQVKEVTFEDLLHLYLKGDFALYAQKMALDEKEIAELQQKILNYLLKATEHQYYERFLEPLNDYDKKRTSDEDRQAYKKKIGMLLSMQRCYNPSEHPEMLLFEYLDNKLIYPEQYHYLVRLLQRHKEGFQSQIVKLIMGGGKSKILLPLLALSKATGNNLVVMEVPEALFEINRADLNSITEKLFGRKAHTFQFDESVNCTPQYLINLKRKLRTIIQNRDYLISTKESLQALELKYLKILRYGDLKDPSTRYILTHLSDILRIFKSQGDFLIDEVDSTLDIRKELIYTAGKTRQLSKTIATSGFDFFQFLEGLSFGLERKAGDEPEGKGGQRITFKQIITHEITPTTQQWKFILEQIAIELIRNKASPFQTIVADHVLGNAEALQLKEYFLGKSKKIPDFIKSLPAKQKEIVALYKLELESLLTATLNKKKNVNFGKTLDPKKPEELQEIAIPYLGNYTPNEKSRFKNTIETLNYSLFLHYGEPVNDKLFHQLLRQFKTEQEEESKIGLAKGKRSAVERFLELTGTALDDVDMNNKAQIKTLYEANCNKLTVKRFCMINFVLTKISENEEYIASNAHNHCGQGRSIQGMTGTDWNRRALPKKLHSQNALPGSDGQVMDYLERHSGPSHLLSETPQNADAAIASAIKLLNDNPDRKKFHAWIDLGAHFRGVPNQDVAKGFVDYFKANEIFAHLKYVLFFEPNGKLYALPISGGEKILLKESSPEYIKERLDVGPDAYFVYYDQRRTTGTDIKQARDARAFLTIAADTLKRDYFQASLRMREIAENQRIDAVIPKECQDLHPEIERWESEKILDICRENEDKRMAEDHYKGALQEMRQRLRDDCLKRIYRIHDIDAQHFLIEKFHQAFFSKIESSLFALHGGVNEDPAVETVLNEQKKDLCDKWLSMLKGAGITPSIEEQMKFTEKMDEIIRFAVPISLDTVQRQVVENKDAIEKREMMEFGDAVEVENTETAEKTEEQELDYTQSGEATPAAMRIFYSLHFHTPELRTQAGIITLEEMAQKGASFTRSGQARVKERSWQFSPDIFVTHDFAHSLTAQPNLMDAYKKENIFFLVHHNPEDPVHPIQILLMTPEEALYNSKRIDDSGKFWIETPHNTVHKGKKPKDLPPQYSILLEQIRFFNGDMDLLYQNMEIKGWLAEATSQKLEFLERIVQPLHRDKPNLLRTIRNQAKQIYGSSKALRFGQEKGMPAPTPASDTPIPRRDMP